MGRVLGIDFGHKRLGLALSDPLGSIASPLEPLARKADLVQQLAQVCREHEVDKVLLGLPILLNGREGEAAQHVRQFGAKLALQLQLPVVFLDERFSTVEAERAMLASDASRAKRKAWRDSIAAAILLQAFLNGASPSP